jgi:hypothetical protein
MYSLDMWKCCYGVLVMILAAWPLAGCHTASPQAAAPTPEAEQVISQAIKDRYMAVSMAPPQSETQQKLILRMAQEAANGKELLLVMRAGVGVFSSSAGPGAAALEKQVRSTVTARMLQLATLDQLGDYATEYPVDATDARPLVERMFELGDSSTDARVWYRIRAAAFHLKVSDLEQQAQARADQLAQR